MPEMAVLPFDSDAFEPDDEPSLVAAAATGANVASAMPATVHAVNSFLYIGRGLNASQFQAYIKNYNFGTIPPDFVVLHHTAVPGTRFAPFPGGSLWDDNEAGLTEPEIYQRRKSKLDGIRNYYQNTNGWDRGPHLFIDDRYIWLFSPLYEPGIHAKTGNSFHKDGRLHYSIGIEVVGYYEHVHWPPAVEQMVGHAVAVLKQRLGTFELEYRPGPTNQPQNHVNSISSHRDYNKPACPGGAITEDYYLGVLRRGWEQLGQPIQPPAPHLSLDSPLMGPESGTRDQAVAYIEAHLPPGSEYENDVQLITWYYWVYARQVGLDPFLAMTQCIFETDSLRSWWAGRPRRNPAGLGVHEEGGLSFPTWGHAVRAHLGQLLAYALKDNEANAAQLEMMQSNPRHHRIKPEDRGRVKTVRDLGGRWTANPDYGFNMVRRAQDIQS